jgi:hypothetical protein
VALVEKDGIAGESRHARSFGRTASESCGSPCRACRACPKSLLVGETAFVDGFEHFFAVAPPVPRIDTRTFALVVSCIVL